MNKKLFKKICSFIFQFLILNLIIINFCRELDIEINILIIIFINVAYLCGYLFWQLLKKESHKNINNVRYGEFDFGNEGKKLPKINEINYFRDIPCNKDLIKMYWICSQYEILPEETLNKKLIEAMLLKLIKENYISLNKNKTNLFNIMNNGYSIDLSKVIEINDLKDIHKIKNNLGYELIKILKSSTTNNNILEPLEFEVWYMNNKHLFETFFYNINIKVIQDLKDEGLITTYKQKYRDFFQYKFKEIKKVDPKLKEEAIKILGFKKFINDFSAFSELKSKDVHLWEDYLIFATLIDETDKVEEQFSNYFKIDLKR